jgi:hypothetical protein
MRDVPRQQLQCLGVMSSRIIRISARSDATSLLLIAKTLIVFVSPPVLEEIFFKR